MLVVFFSSGTFVDSLFPLCENCGRIRFVSQLTCINLSILYNKCSCDYDVCLRSYLGRQQGSLSLFVFLTHAAHSFASCCGGSVVSFVYLEMDPRRIPIQLKHTSSSWRKGGWMWDIRFGCHCLKKKAIKQTALFTQTPATYLLRCEPIPWAG